MDMETIYGASFFVLTSIVSYIAIVLSFCVSQRFFFGFLGRALPPGWCFQDTFTYSELAAACGLETYVSKLYGTAHVT